MRIVWWSLGTVYLTLGVGAWATDFVTLQNQSTVYTVDCRDGHWEGDLCTGSLAPTQRYRFEARKRYGEVVSWIVGSPDKKAHYKDCDIRDGRNWACKYRGHSDEPVTLRLTEGHAQMDSSEQSIAHHAVQKIRWLLLHWGLPAGHEDDGESVG